jgi:hypothetical protein
MKNLIKISVQTQDRKIYRKDQLVAAFFQAVISQGTLEIDFYPEGSCATALGLYRLLDELCEKYVFDKSKITIKTGNLIESHEHYQIDKQPEYWYEIPEIHEWRRNNSVDTGISPSMHFGCFVSRTTWPRLWISTYLDKKFANKTLQTYHYDRHQENFNGNGYVGLDDLFRFKCDIIPDCAEFLMTCPRTIDLDYLKTQNNEKSIFQHVNSYYPIQVPANLNLLNYYHKIFVDIVNETNVFGTTFFVTEKLWRCMLARRPFIVLGPSNYLYNLRKLGFLTFGQWWNEDYDGQIAQTRISWLIKVIDQIADWDIKQCQEVLRNMSSVLEHNYQTFINLDHNKLRQVFQIDQS